MNLSFCSSSSSFCFISLRTSCERPPCFFLKGDSATGKCSSFWNFLIPTISVLTSSTFCFKISTGLTTFSSALTSSFFSYFTYSATISFFSGNLIFSSTFVLIGSYFLSSTFFSSYLGNDFWSTTVFLSS